MAGLGDARGAGTAGRALHPSGVQQHQQGIGLAAVEDGADDAGQGIVRGHHPDTGIRGHHDLDDLVAQLRHRHTSLGTGQVRGPGGTQRGGHRGSSRNVQRAGVQAPLLPTAEHQWVTRHTRWQHQCTHSNGGAELVPADGIRRPRGRRAPPPPRGLHGVDVERHAVGGSQFGQFPDGLHRADLVVGRHHRHHRHPPGIGGQDGRGIVDQHAALGIDRQPHHALPVIGGRDGLGGVEHRVVLHRRHDHGVPRRVLRVSSGMDAAHGQVVGHGAAGGEDDVTGVAGQFGGQRLAGLLQYPARGPAGGVQAGGVAAGGRQPGGGRLRTHRSRRRMIQVRHGGRFYVASSGSPSGSGAGPPPGTSRAPALASAPATPNTSALKSLRPRCGS